MGGPPRGSEIDHGLPFGALRATPFAAALVAGLHLPGIEGRFRGSEQPQPGIRATFRGSYEIGGRPGEMDVTVFHYLMMTFVFVSNLLTIRLKRSRTHSSPGNSPMSC